MLLSLLTISSLTHSRDFQTKPKSILTLLEEKHSLFPIPINLQLHFLCGCCWDMKEARGLGALLPYLHR